MSNDSTGSPGRFSSLGIGCWSFLWGLAEATVFFIVPDVLLTGVAIRCTKTSLKACVYALAGAMIGGVCMFIWGQQDAKSAHRLLESIPAINAEMIDTVDRQMHEDGPLALFTGPLRGRPYKIYAVNAGAQETDLSTFILVSMPARMIRFVLLAVIAAFAAQRLLRRFSEKQVICVHVAGCCFFYSWYFSHFGI